MWGPAHKICPLTQRCVVTAHAICTDNVLYLYAQVNIGLRFFGGNVAEMWASELMLDSWNTAGIELRGYAIRTARPRAAANHTPAAPLLADADGNEIYAEQIPAYALKHDGAILPCPPYCAKGSPPGSVEVGGGQPSVVVERVVASGHHGWLVDSDCGAVRLHTVRLEGQAGLMRNTGVPGAWPAACDSPATGNCGPIADGRFTDILIDVSNSYGNGKSTPLNNTAISFVSPAADDSRHG